MSTSFLSRASYFHYCNHLIHQNLFWLSLGTERGDQWFWWRTPSRVPLQGLTTFSLITGHTHWFEKFWCDENLGYPAGESDTWLRRHRQRRAGTEDRRCGPGSGLRQPGWTGQAWLSVRGRLDVNLRLLTFALCLCRMMAGSWVCRSLTGRRTKISQPKAFSLRTSLRKFEVHATDRILNSSDVFIWWRLIVTLFTQLSLELFSIFISYSLVISSSSFFFFCWTTVKTQINVLLCSAHVRFWNTSTTCFMTVCWARRNTKGNSSFSFIWLDIFRTWRVASIF